MMKHTTPCMSVSAGLVPSPPSGGRTGGRPRAYHPVPLALLLLQPPLEAPAHRLVRRLVRLLVLGAAVLGQGRFGVATG